MMLKGKKEFVFRKTTDDYVVVLREKKCWFSRFWSPAVEPEGEKPREGCRAHFSGGLISDEFVKGHISQIYMVDDYSEYVGAGEYKKNKTAFPKAVETTFDGIAIDRNTRVIIYSKQNFRGKVLLNCSGPAIINNIIWKNDERIRDFVTKKFKEPLESNFPPSVRQWSKTNMEDWSNGSVKVICIG